MVCLAASLVSKNGKVLVSRQFVDMNRIRVEALLAAFPKLLGSGKQHTFVETENVRYVYQPMDGLYLLLITNKQSNILEDLETLRLLSKVVPEYVDAVDEAAIADTAFELLFAFDEVISLGHKEEVTVAQVGQNTDMRSFEEDLANALLAQKVEDVKSHMRAKAQEIDRTKQDQKTGSQPWRSGVTIPSDSAMSQPTSGIDAVPSQMETAMAQSLLYSNSAASKPSKGMKLSKDKKSNLLSALAKEGVDVTPITATAPAAAPIVANEPVSLTIEEKLSVRMNKEGGLENIGVQGSLMVLCSDEAHAFFQLVLKAGANQGVQFSTHPNIDKGLYNSQKILGTRDPSKPFPVGMPQHILKWRFQSTDMDLVPLTINCWPTPSRTETYINIEYEATNKFDLQNVSITIPGIYSSPNVSSCTGDWRFDSKANSVLWTIELIDESNLTGSMEFSVDPAAPESFFPCTASFTAKHTLCDISVDKCLNTKTQEPARFESSQILSVAKFDIVH